MTVNIVALFIVFSGSVILKDPPLTVVQMLWVNLIMDTFAALALATEAPKGELMLRKPYGKFDAIINEVMWRNIFGQSIYQIAMMSWLLVFGKEFFNLPFEVDTPFYYQDASSGFALGAASNKTIIYTMVFQSFVFMCMFN